MAPEAEVYIPPASPEVIVPSVASDELEVPIVYSSWSPSLHLFLQSHKVAISQDSSFLLFVYTPLDVIIS